MQVKSFTPFLIKAVIEFSGIPHNPKPPNIKTALSGISFTASAGKIDINLTPAKTKLFNFPRSAYQLQLTTAGGVKTTLLTGWFIVNAGVIN
jgi:hypothetical protein